jgi:hypothetical protein
MTQFEYLSVLVSIIVGLALTQLLSGVARLIHLRSRIRPHAALTQRAARLACCCASVSATSLRR